MLITVAPDALETVAGRLVRVESELTTLRTRLVTTALTVAHGVDGHTAAALTLLARDADHGLAHLVDSVVTLSAALRDAAGSYRAVDGG